MKALPAEWLRHRLRELAADRGRVALVILGIMWGALSLTVVLSFGRGFHSAMLHAIQASGKNMIRISSGMTTRPYAGQPAGRWIELLPEDAPLIERQLPGVQAVSVEYSSSVNSMEYQGLKTNVRVHGVSACYGELRSMLPEAGGRFINEQDSTERRRVVFLANEVKQRLLGEASAVGAMIKLWGMPFTVIGTLRPKITLSNYHGMDPEKVFIPATTFQVLRGWRNPSLLIIGLASMHDDQHAVQALYQILGKQHSFDPEDKAAMFLWNQIEYDRRTLASVNGTQILIRSNGVLGLSVALIGVANVMFVLVEERRREIGIQMALGAKPATLKGGFFFEGLVMTFSGGALGLFASAGVLRLFNLLPLGDLARGYLGRPEMSLATAAAVTAFLGIAGCLAGYFPARRAASLDPVAALREE